MNLMMAIQAALGSVSPMTVTSWGASSGVDPHSSASRTITVPSGNPGAIKFSINSNDGTLEYKKNADAFAAVTHNGTITVTNGATLQFRLTGSITSCNLDVLDDTTETVIGSWVASTTT